MNFHHLAYWQDKALSLAIENRLFINGEYTAADFRQAFSWRQSLITHICISLNCSGQSRCFSAIWC